MKKLFFIIGCIFSLSLISCKHNNKIEEFTGKIRVINASYLAGEINADVDYEKIYESNIIYLNYTHFRPFMEGKHKIQIKNAVGDVIIDTSFTMIRENYFSVIVYDSANTIKYLFIKENLKFSSGSSSNIRFLHLSNDAPVADIYCTPDTTPRFVQYINGNYSEYAKMENSLHQFIAINSLTKDTLCIQAPYNYKSGAYYTLFLRGNTNSNGIDSLNFSLIEDTSNYD